MTLRFVPTPLEHPLEPPAPRGTAASTRRWPTRSCPPPPGTRSWRRLRRARRARGHHRAAAGALHRPALHHPQGAERRRARPRARAALAAARWSRSSGSPATTTISPRRARPSWIAADGARGHAPRSRRARPTRRSRRCTASRWATASSPPSRRSRPGCRPRSSATRRWPGSSGITVPEATVAGSFAGAHGRAARAARRRCCLDSTHPAAKRAAAPHLVRALRPGRASSTTTSTAGRRRSGTAARTSGVTVGDGAALVMLEASLGRDRLVAGRRRLRHPAEPRAVRPRRPPADRRRRARAALAQRAAPPGGRERAAADRRLPRRPGRAPLPGARPRRSTSGCGSRGSSPLPRWSGVIVEPRVDRVLEKFGVDLADLLAPPGAARGAAGALAAAGRGGPGARAAPGRPRRGYGAAGARRREIDPTLARPIQGARQQALAGTQDIEKKLVQHLKRRQETELGQLGQGPDRGAAGRQAAGAGPDRGAVPGALRPGAARRADATPSKRGTRAALEGPPEPA